MTEHAEILARFAASWHNRRFMTIDNESDEGRQFLGAVEAVLAEHDAVLADNERLTRELDDLADFDKADERRQRLQDERDRAVKLWHEQHKQLSAVRVVADMLAGTALPPGDLGPTAHAIGAIRVDVWHQAAGMIRTALEPPAVAAPDTATRATVTDPDETRDGAQRGQEGPWAPKVGTGTTQARESARTPPAAPDPNEAGR